MTESILSPDSDALPEIDGYDLIQEIGRGGMGVVYEAFQRSTGRRVAVKFMRPSDEIGVADTKARHRFEREVELVARLQHPHIASVLDSGMHNNRAYCVLEFIEGVPLDAHLNFGECEVRAAMELMALICEAVDYAHQRGVLHRDLKPSNILIDARGEPHVLDFGLAKHIDPSSRWGIDVTLSSPGQIVGTLGYMSPEQSRGQYGEMSVRSDVYSLGAIMYQMLTGQLPCSIAGPLSEVLRGIAEKEPPRASSIRPELDRDIDAILYKCLDKGSHRRYATAGELAADCRRYLHHEPIRARPPTPYIQIAKWIQRNKRVAAVAALSLMAIIVITTLSFQRILRERDSSRAAAQWGKDVITSMNPAEGTKTQTMFATMVDTAARTLETQLRDHPAEQASARLTLGQFLMMLERYEEARDQFDQSLNVRRTLFGERSREAAEAMLNRARALTWIARQQSGEQRTEQLRNALSVYEQVQTIRLHTDGARSEPYAECLHELGSVQRDLNDLDRAEQLFSQAMELRRDLHGEGSWLLAATRNNLALLFVRQGRHRDAQQMFEAALATLRSLPEAEQKPLFEARTHQNLGECLMSLGQHEGAEEHFRDALHLKLILFDEHSSTVSKTKLCLAESLLAQCGSDLDAVRASELLSESEQLLHAIQFAAGSPDAARAHELKNRLYRMQATRESP